jgi:hypothetical protein
MVLALVTPQLAISDPNTATGPAVNVELEVVIAGTATRVPLFQDAAGTVPLAQPIRTGDRGFTQEFWVQVDALTTLLAWRSGGLQGGYIKIENQAAAIAQKAATDAAATLAQTSAALQGVDKIEQVPGWVSAAQAASESAAGSAATARSDGRAAAIETLTTQPGIITAAEAAVVAAADDLDLVTKETTDADVFEVRFDDGDAFIQADEERGIFGTRIAHLPDSVSVAAATFTTELDDSQGWAWVVAYEDGEIAYGQRLDGTRYPATGDEPRQASRVIIRGDSLTASWASSTAGLSAALGCPVTALGNGGHSSFWIAARQGGQPMRVTVDGGSIPASGSVGVTLDFVPRVEGATGSTSRPSATGSYTGSIGAVAGTLQITASGVGTFTRAASGRATPVPAATPFVAGAETRDHLPIHWIGRNNFKLSGDRQQIVNDHRRMAEWTKRRDALLILSIPPWVGEEIGTGTRSQLDSVNAALRDEFPTAFLDVAAMLRSTALLTAVGITPTATDLANIDAGLTPASFRSDEGHLNSKGYEALNLLIADAYTSRGLI